MFGPFGLVSATPSTDRTVPILGAFGGCLSSRSKRFIITDLRTTPQAPIRPLAAPPPNSFSLQLLSVST
jgi:hypothetical protein